MGEKINSDVLLNARAEYGKQVIKYLSEQLTLEYGRGWSQQQLRHCMHLASTFINDEIFYSMRRELSWTNIRTLFFGLFRIERYIFRKRFRNGDYSGIKV